LSPSIGGLSSGTATSGVLTNLTAGTSTIRVGASNASTTFAGSIQDGGAGKLVALIKTGTGALVLSGTNRYSTGTLVENGSLILSNADALEDGTSLTIGAGASLMFGLSVVDASTANTQIPSPPANGVVAPVPEPGTLAVLASGAAMIGLSTWRRRRERDQ
jgi:autotransporter-associated beta strand protein